MRFDPFTPILMRKEADWLANHIDFVLDTKEGFWVEILGFYLHYCRVCGWKVEVRVGR